MDPNVIQVAVAGKEVFESVASGSEASKQDTQMDTEKENKEISEMDLTSSL